MSNGDYKDDIRSIGDVMRDQINSESQEAVMQLPSLPEHETVNAESSAVGEIDIPEEIEEWHGLDEEIIDELEPLLTQVRIVPSAFIIFRAQENDLQHLLRTHKRIEGDDVSYDLCNPLVSGKRANKTTGAIGVLREPILEFFKYLGTVINQNAVFVGDSSDISKYLDLMFQKIEQKLNYLLYGNHDLIGNDDFSIDKRDLFATSVSLVVEEGEETIARVNIEVVIHVAQLLAGIDRAEPILKNYLKFLTRAFADAGISEVNAGVVFDVEDFGAESNAFELFNLLVAGKLNVKPKAVVNSANHEYKDSLAFHSGCNALVMLSSELEPTQEAS